MRSLAMVALALSSSAAQEPSEELGRVLELEHRAVRLLERMAEADSEVRSLEVQSTAVAGVYAESTELFADASTAFARSARKANWATIIVIIGSLIPAGHELVCSYSMSPEAYRRLMSLAAGVDVDHKWPKSWGGVDNRLNYQALPSGENRSVGAQLIRKLSRPETLEGAVVTLLGRNCAAAWTLRQPR